MAKVPFTKLKCKINTDEIPVQIGDETIAVKQYLPIQEKLSLIGRVIEYAHEQDYNYSNPVKTDVIMELEIVFVYTNISFTDKQKEDLPKLYDMLKSSGILKIILDSIPEEEYISILCGIENTVEAIYKYQNSVLGLLDGIKKSYNETEFNIEEMQEAVKELANSPVLNKVISYLG